MYSTLSVCAQPTYFLLSVGQAASDTLINGCHSVRAMLLLCVPPTPPASALRSGRTDLSLKDICIFLALLAAAIEFDNVQVVFLPPSFIHIYIFSITFNGMDERGGTGSTGGLSGLVARVCTRRHPERPLHRHRLFSAYSFFPYRPLLKRKKNMRHFYIIKRKEEGKVAMGSLSQ